ncbi:MAG TPA: EamA family transporter RarD [Candidatus Deferrimicrobium sp.]|nr:EamA family transporter RarD [Candidatus Deferrimicrobium sp.]
MVQQNNSSMKSHTKGVLYAIAAYGAWGILPLYWKALKQVPAPEILAHRIIWSFVFVSVLLTMLGGLKDLRNVVSSGKNILGIFLGSLLISANWFIYIWAVNSNQVIETSLGYYINPLITVILGLVVLRERVDRGQVASLILALLAVGIETFQYGKIPWVSLGLAVSFGLYGLVKKLSNVSSLNGLALETIIVTPMALGFVAFKHVGGAGAFGNISITVTCLLIFSGVVTATPLLWFAKGAKLIPLTTIGFIQYLSPSISLILGIFVFKEPFTIVDVFSFGLIWCALAVYSLSRKEFLNSIKLKSLNQRA